MANRNYRLLRNASRTALRQAKKRGVQITLMSPESGGGDTVTLWAFLDADQNTIGLQHGLTDQDSVRFVVPRHQTNFPDPLVPGAILTYNEVEYGVDKVTPDAEDLTHCATVMLVCTRFGSGNPELQ